MTINGTNFNEQYAQSVTRDAFVERHMGLRHDLDVDKRREWLSQAYDLLNGKTPEKKSGKRDNRKPKED